MSWKRKGYLRLLSVLGEPYDGILNNIQTEHLIKTPHIASTCSDFLIGMSNDFLNFHNKILNGEF